MARSTCVYVVLTEGGVPLAGFTVKHELVTWLRRGSENPDDVQIWRCGDGPWQKPPVRLDVAELLGGAR